MSPRNPNTNKELRDSKHEKILKAGLNVFSRKGFHGVRMADIAAEAGISHGLVYHYFPSKEELFCSLVQTAYETSNALFRSALEAPTGGRLRFFFAGITSGALEGPNILYFLLVLQALTLESLPSPVRVMNERFIRENRIMIESILDQEGAYDRQNRVGLQQLVTVFLAMIIGLPVVMKQGGIFTPPDSAVLMALFGASGRYNGK